MQTLEDFYAFMDELATLRSAVTAHFRQHTETAYHRESLEKALAAVDDLPGTEIEKRLSAGGREITVTVDYERRELEKDLRFLNQDDRGSDAFLADYNDGFDAAVTALVDFLGSRRYTTSVSDRDGTVNNYCGRYRSSHQSIYNAVFLSRFAQNRADNPVLLTSAPLANHGLLDLSAMPEHSIHYAGSKGREYYSIEGVQGRMPIEAEQRKALETLNERIAHLLSREENRIFSLIGSAIQYKFGQTTVSRQDIHGSVPQRKSETFLAAVRELVRDVDPDESTFRIEDTGLDIEIMLTVGGARDFDKGDGIRFLDEELELNLASGPNLICGDTSSDVPMAETAIERCGADDTFVVFVTEDDELKERVARTGANTYFAPSPDVLVAALGRMGVDGDA